MSSSCGARPFGGELGFGGWWRLGLRLFGRVYRVRRGEGVVARAELPRGGGVGCSLSQRLTLLVSLRIAHTAAEHRQIDPPIRRQFERAASEGRAPAGEVYTLSPHPNGPRWVRPVGPYGSTTAPTRAQGCLGS
eukprot:6635901-Pyramimonas_sp.AAC.2